MSAVYNYTRRSAAIDEILMRLFGLVSFNFYDDKYGLEPVEMIQSVFLAAQKVHFWQPSMPDLGQASRARSDLQSGRLGIRDQRRPSPGVIR